MKVKIRLLKDWKNGDTDFPEGQLLMLEESDSVGLIEKGIGEIYEPHAEDVLVVSPVDGNVTPEQVKKVVDDHLKEVNRNNAAAHLDAGDDPMVKTGGFVNMAEFCQHVWMKANGRSSEKIAAWGEHQKNIKISGLGEDVNIDGGYLVPTEFRNELLSDSLQQAIVRPRAMVIPMATNHVMIPTIDESSRASSVFGGVIIYRPGEGETKTASKPKFGQVELTLSKLIGLVYVSDELLEDSPISLQPLLTSRFSAAIAFQEDEDFINGTGAGQALGILNAPCLITVSKEGGQAATTIESNNLFKMKSRLNPRSWGRAVWFANQDTYVSLRTLSIEVGTGGSVMNLLHEGPNGVQSLDGTPILFTEHCQTLGTKGDLYLSDWSQYLIGSKANGLQVASSIHVKFENDETAFRFVLRYDGQPWEKSARTPKHGSSTVSSFITLADRS